MKVIVVGGAGFIGSHMSKVLARESYEVVILDNLSKGYRELASYGEFVYADLGDLRSLDAIFRRIKPEAVLHFASFIEVGHSVTDPEVFYYNNFTNTLNLLNVMIRHHVMKFIFSSTAAVFGNPAYTPIDENHPKSPINPYGRSKFFVEEVLKDYASAYCLSSVVLRYFNAAGGDSDGELGEMHDPETHLIPLGIDAAIGKRGGLEIYGTDYDTPDGTCIRDYVHVLDLCEAHLLALEKLRSSKVGFYDYNLGNGSGYSVKQVISAIERVTGLVLPRTYGPRRKGDPAVLIANPQKAISELGWSPKFQDLDVMVKHAYAWRGR